MPALTSRRRVEALLVETRIDRVGADLARMQLLPDLGESRVVLAPTEGARSVTRGERGGLIQEEQLGEPARLEQRRVVPSLEAEPACDPSLDRVPAADPASVVVEASAVPVDEAACRSRDQIAERRDPVLDRHDILIIDGADRARHPDRSTRALRS
jgi:hypothetical protein